MKFLVTTLVLLLALAHGGECGSLGKRDVQSEIDRVAKLINEMSAKITAATQELVDKVKALDMANTAQTYVEGSRARIQPLVEKVQAQSARLQEQVKPLMSNIEDLVKPLTDNFSAQVKPLTDNFHAQVKPLADIMEGYFRQVMEQTRALMPPQ